MRFKKIICFFVFTLLIAGAPTEKRDVLQRVAITGASVSAGYGIKTPPIKGDLSAYPMNFSHVMDAMILGEHEKVMDFCDTMFFRSSRTNVQSYIQQIKEYKPTLVVGIDILFWFGYGSVPSGVSESEYRMERLNFALGLLDELQAPLVIGDIPDVSAAMGKMLSQNYVPSVELLSKLNARVHAWADENPNVYLMPVHEYWGKMMRDESITLLGRTWDKGTKDRLLQKDMLHMTREGTVVSGLLVAKLLGDIGFERDPKVIMKKAAEKARGN